MIVTNKKKIKFTSKKQIRCLTKVKQFCGAAFMDLSKGFGTLNHRILLANFKAYGLQQTAPKQMENYLTGRFQRTKVSNSYSS